MNGESPEALQAFQLYATMGPTRSLVAVGNRLGKSDTLMSRWSAKYKWVERAASYDNAIVEAKIRGHVKVAEKDGEREARLAEKMIKVSERSMDAYLQDDPLMIRPRDAAVIGAEGVKISRLVSGQSTDITQKPVINIILVESRDDVRNADKRIRELLPEE